jgi:DNA-binding response OmpR family regulator
MRILLIEDDPGLGMAVRDQMVADGHSVDWVKRLDEGGGVIHAVLAVWHQVVLRDGTLTRMSPV